MKLSVSNINAQFAWFRKEMESGFKTSWTEICSTEKAKKVSDIFLEKIETPREKNYEERRNYAKIIYDKMKKF